MTSLQDCFVAAEKERRRKILPINNHVPNCEECNDGIYEKDTSFVVDYGVFKLEMIVCNKCDHHRLI